MSMAMKRDQSPLFVEGTCPVDFVLAGIVSSLLLYGLVMVGSSSLEVGAKTYANAFYLLNRHVVYLCIGISAAIVALALPISFWQKFDGALLVMGLLLLLLVLIPGVGREVNGSVRSMPFGPFSLQGSEFVKLFVLVYIAGYLVRRKEEIASSFSGFAKPLIVLTAVALLLLGQPDFGSAIVIITSSIGVIYLAGVPLRYFVPLATICFLVMGLIAALEPYRLARLTTFVDPWGHQLGGGYQLTQALIAFGRGEWFGLGLGNSIQKLFFLPEAHTDFLFSIIAEELGVVGAGLVIILFTCLVLRGLLLAQAARNKGLEFHAFLAYGIALIIGIQASIHLGVNLGVLPTKGLTLPLMSYGGNSLIVSCVMIAILLRIDFEARQVSGTDVRGQANV